MKLVVNEKFEPEIQLEPPRPPLLPSLRILCNGYSTLTLFINTSTHHYIWISHAAAPKLINIDNNKNTVSFLDVSEPAQLQQPESCWASSIILLVIRLPQLFWGVSFWKLHVNADFTTSTVESFDLWIEAVADQLLRHFGQAEEHFEITMAGKQGKPPSMRESRLEKHWKDLVKTPILDLNLHCYEIFDIKTLFSSGNSLFRQWVNCQDIPSHFT